jgi:hypothetical protein
MNNKNDFFGIHRTTLLVIVVATIFGSFGFYKALGGGISNDRTVSGTALAAGVDGSRTIINPQSSAMRLTSAPRPRGRTTLTPIEQIQVGDRDLAESPTGEEDTAFGSEIIPSDWRTLTLRAPKRDGTTAEVVLLRPLTWLNEQYGEVGGTVFISVPECGIDGNANVLAIDSCPEIPSGGGRVVTGTFLHQARSTITLTIAGQSEPIECTGNHPFWSEDRQAFVRADSLQPNETLRTANGLTTVESWTPDLNPTPVYNIEVHGAHVYHVGTSGVVVHNSGLLPIIDPCFRPTFIGHADDFDPTKVLAGLDDIALVNDIAETMKHQKGWGSIDPVLIHTGADGMKTIVDGHHRIDAARIAGVAVRWMEATPEELKRFWKW